MKKEILEAVKGFKRKGSKRDEARTRLQEMRETVRPTHDSHEDSQEDSSSLTKQEERNWRSMKA